MTPCDCRQQHDASPCLCYCHATYAGRDGLAQLDSDEVADLAILAARRRDAERSIERLLSGGVNPARLQMAYADDLQPLMREGQPIPWAVVLAGVTAY